MSKAPERIWRVKPPDDDWRWAMCFDKPEHIDDDYEPVEYVRKDVMDRIIQETLWQCHGVRM
jgi:hypothetical protein